MASEHPRQPEGGPPGQGQMPRNRKGTIVRDSPRAMSYRHHHPYHLSVSMLLALAIFGCVKMEPEGTVPAPSGLSPWHVGLAGATISIVLFFVV